MGTEINVSPDGSVRLNVGALDIAKAVWDGETIEGTLIKAEAERRYTLTVVYPADKADVGVAADGHLDFASKSAVEDAAWAWMAKHRNVGTDHVDGTDNAGTVVESYVYRGPDWAVKSADGESEVVIKSGDWLMGTVWAPPVWERWKSGEFNGVSPQGGAVRATPTADEIAALRS